MAGAYFQSDAGIHHVFSAAVLADVMASLAAGVWPV